MNKKLIALSLSLLSFGSHADGVFDNFFEGVDVYAGIGYKDAEFAWGIDNAVAGSPDKSMLNWAASAPELTLSLKSLNNNVTFRYATNGNGSFFDEDWIHGQGGKSKYHHTESDVEYTSMSVENLATLYRFGTVGVFDEINFQSLLKLEYDNWLAVGLDDLENDREMYDKSHDIIDMDVFSLTALYGFEFAKVYGDFRHDLSVMGGANVIYAIDNHLKRTDLADDSFVIGQPYAGFRVGYNLGYIVDSRSLVNFSVGYEHYWVMGDTVNVTFADGQTGYTGLVDAEEGSWTVGVNYRLTF